MKPGMGSFKWVESPRTQLFRVCAPVLLATILIGCASSLPPLQPATSLKSIAGTWKGFTTDAAGRPLYPATLVIKEDGTYQYFNPTVREAPFSGTIVIENGKFQWSDSATGGRANSRCTKATDGGC